MEVDGHNAAELLFTPAIDQDTHALFLRQIAESDPEALHVIIQDQAGFHLPADDPRLPPTYAYFLSRLIARNSIRSSDWAV